MATAAQAKLDELQAKRLAVLAETERVGKRLAEVKAAEAEALTAEVLGRGSMDAVRRVQTQLEELECRQRELQQQREAIDDLATGQRDELTREQVREWEQQHRELAPRARQAHERLALALAAVEAAAAEYFGLTQQTDRLSAKISTWRGRLNLPAADLAAVPHVRADDWRGRLQKLSERMQ